MKSYRDDVLGLCNDFMDGMARLTRREGGATAIRQACEYVETLRQSYAVSGLPTSLLERLKNLLLEYLDVAQRVESRTTRPVDFAGRV